MRYFNCRTLMMTGALALAMTVAWVMAPPAAWACDDGDNDREQGGGSHCAIKVTGAVFTTDEDGSGVNGNLYDNALDVYLRVGRGYSHSRKTIAPHHGYSKHHEREWGKHTAWTPFSRVSETGCSLSKRLRGDCGSRFNWFSKKKTPSPTARDNARDNNHKDKKCSGAWGTHGSCSDDIEEGGHGRPAGLTDGLYYFQVTDPSGETLLSIDSIKNRQFEVVNGYIQDVPGSHNFNVLDSPFPAGYTVVQLAPFRPTPNKGGEYKIWVTPVAAYVAGQGYHGFLPSCSKTDNFRIRSGGDGTLSAFILGAVFFDADLDGAWDTDGTTPESGQGSIQINVYTQGSSDVLDYFTSSGGEAGSGGEWSFQLTPPSLPYTYRVEPVLNSDLGFSPTLPPAYEVTISTSGQVAENLLFGVVAIGSPGGNIEFDPDYWANADTASTSQGEMILQQYFANYDDPDALPAFLRAPILQQQSCAAAGVLTSAEAVESFLTQNAKTTASTSCQMAAYWLSLMLAIDANGISATVTPALVDNLVVTVSGTAQVYIGLDVTTGLPLYGTLQGLLDLVAANFDSSAPEFDTLTGNLAFYAEALTQAAERKNFVRAASNNTGW